MAVALLLLSRRRPRDLAYAAGAAVVVVLGAALPWGLVRVWDQSVVYDRDASTGDVVPGRGDEGPAHARRPRPDRARRRRPRRGDARPRPPRMVARAPAPTPPPTSPCCSVLLLCSRSGWRRSSRCSSTSRRSGARTWRSSSRRLALLVALRPPPVIALLIGAAVVMPWYWSNVHPMLWPDPYSRAEQAAVDALHGLPPGSLAISDEPGFLWRADRLTVPYFDDSSIKRIEQGQITAREAPERGGETERVRRARVDVPVREPRSRPASRPSRLRRQSPLRRPPRPVRETRLPSVTPARVTRGDARAAARGGRRRAAEARVRSRG